jgi:RNA polymerase sigma-70 factor, ECF subfamily
MTIRDEAALVRETRAGSAAAADELVRRFWTEAYRAAYLVLGDATEAEDVAQDAMISALRSMKRLRDDRHFGPWLHRIVVNRAIDVARASRRRATPASPSIDSVGTEAGESVSDPQLAAAIRALSPDHQAVVVLRFVLGYGPEDIAGILDVPRGTIGSRLRRALDSLRVELGADE